MRLQSLHPLSFTTLTLIGLLLLGITIVIQLQSDRQSAEAFEQQLGIVSDFTIPKDSQIQAVSTSFQSLQSPPTKTLPPHIRFFFTCQDTCGRIWLSYQTDAGDTRILFISHPDINQSPYHYIKLGQMRLYQRQTIYDTIPEFLRNPPKEFILTDAYATQKLLHPLAQTIDATTSTDVNSDFIYLNYQSPRRFTNDWYEVSRYLLELNTPGASVSATLHHPDWQTHPIWITTPKLL